MEQQVQQMINSGLLVIDDNGLPAMNVEKVLESERQSQISEQSDTELVQPITNRRQAQVFGQNMLSPVDENQNLDIDLE